MVNNRRVTKKDLEPGDVINFNGTIAVFDDDESLTRAKGGASKTSSSSIRRRK
jgi:pSer/pThr/pTyr-binding forkhead associated (FHA) protein